MAQLYGRRWTDTYGSVPSPLWVTGLRTVSAEQITHGMGELVKRAEAWPPSLPEFLGLCKSDAPGVRFLGRPTTPDQAAALDVKPSAPETRDAWLAKIRSHL